MWKGKDSIMVSNLESDNSSNIEQNVRADGSNSKSNVTNDNVTNNLTNKEYWDFLRAISDKLTITELALKFEDKFPDLLNKSILDGRIESFTSE